MLNILGGGLVTLFYNVVWVTRIRISKVIMLCKRTGTAARKLRVFALSPKESFIFLLFGFSAITRARNHLFTNLALKFDSIISEGYKEKELTTKYDSWTMGSAIWF